MALLERIGMRREAHHHKSAWWRSEWTDEYIYALLAEERPDEPRSSGAATSHCEIRPWSGAG
jgi:aminoglycoside 6'-N-acetyltransferase